MVGPCGHLPVCAKGLCARCYQAAYYVANKAKAKVRVKAWREAHPGVAQEAARARRAANPELFREYQRAYHQAHAADKVAKANDWREANPERARENARATAVRRRARKAGAEGALSLGDWAAILVEFDHRCAYCNAGEVPLEMEHMTPLVRGGRHDSINVVPACGPCNRSKATRTAFEFIGPQTIGA